MNKNRMATHSTSSFDESEEVRILSGVLESKRQIKTFFKENDRTPNHDGNFEIINNDRTPKKQFIVQIKKVENLKPKKSGKNKGKYVYSLNTAFLYYVKEKVTESPAIYFVVDIITKNIFWLYLSDEKLMSLNFENSKGSLSYAFCESEKLIDVDRFTIALNEIAVERNSIFINKTPEEISEMQDAVEYLNNYMNNDFIKMKEVMFPNLWRFGLRHSHTSEFSIIAGEKTIKPENTAAFALYPQIKGRKDAGIQDFNGQNEDGFYNFFDLTGNKKPIEYSKESLEKIIKNFFEYEYAFQFLPTIALCEKLYIFAQKLHRIFNIADENGKFLVEKVYIGLFWLLKYVESILINPHPHNTRENELKQIIERNIKNNGKQSFDFILNFVDCYCVEYFAVFCKSNDTKKLPRLSTALLSLLDDKHIRAYLIAMELKNRGELFLEPVWSYDYFSLIYLSPEELIDTIDKICEEWFSKLPELYNETFDVIFDKNKYRLTGTFEYKNICPKKGCDYPCLVNIIHKYDNSVFLIKHNPSITADSSNLKSGTGIKSIIHGSIFGDFLQRKSLFYDSINCLLYEGVCKELNIKNQGLSIDGKSMTLFK